MEFDAGSRGLDPKRGILLRPCFRTSARKHFRHRQHRYIGFNIGNSVINIGLNIGSANLGNLLYAFVLFLSWSLVSYYCFIFFRYISVLPEMIIYLTDTYCFTSVHYLPHSEKRTIVIVLLLSIYIVSSLYYLFSFNINLV